ncbi:LysR substrate-binding domain-containing protein [Ancylobacter polymorphus]|uniref:DNA-binding transcriptional LysR family regulator n=1 Tax=Ancylobacter polymorphus TaxID=223390 RepID=A0ABU0BBQ9_9HYPH|nr:LysR substrate-binding domain-containing protein [Ancylobacter polymorphus]MDQ0302753.1 DNA-binding transcriptional LysR family regulator [Ancylobacter polymorphus]
MAFSLRQLQYFVAVAENGSVSSAAHALSISQSTVTESLRELELDLGFKLLERHARGVDLTLKGHHFLRHARKILGDVADARRALAGPETAALTGRLAVGVTPLVAGYIYSDLIARFRRAFPGVAVEAVEDAGDYLEHLLVGGELDVAVMVLPPGRHSAALQTETVEVSPYRVWMPLGHPALVEERVSLRAFSEEPHVLLAIDEIAEASEIVWRRLGIRPPVAFRTRSVEAVRSLVATGAGVAVLPDLTYRPWSLEGDKIEARTLIDTVPAVEVATAWRRGSPLSPAAAGFVAIAATRTRSAPHARG